MFSRSLWILARAGQKLDASSAISRVGILLRKRGPRPGRKLDGEGGALAELALDLDRPAVALHDPETHRQPEPGTAHIGLGCEEGLENTVEVLWSDPGARIDHLDLHHVRAGRRPDGERTAAVPHDVDRVVDEVQEHLLDPRHVDLHG